jgi:hypothetical protein
VKPNSKGNAASIEIPLSHAAVMLKASDARKLGAMPWTQDRIDTIMAIFSFLSAFLSVFLIAK